MNKTTINDYPVKCEYPVHWGDMDSARHVNNLVYLRWGESARIAYFGEIGLDSSFGPDSVGPILSWQDCKYTFPITFPDTVDVGIKVVEILQDRFTLECAVFSREHQRVASISKQVIVPYDYGALKKANMPEAWIEGVRRIQDGF